MSTLPLAIEVVGLNVSMRGHSVLEDVNFSLEQGGFLGLIGPNGGGKSVLLKTLVGLISPQSGSIKLFGESLDRAVSMVGYVPQFAKFDLGFPVSVLEVVLMGRLKPGFSGLGYSAADRAKAETALRRVEMLDFASRQIGMLSGGQLQRVLIARALCSEPKLLLLDEPTASLDQKVGPSFYDLLSDLSKELTVVLVSHDVGVISQHVKTVACLNRKLHYHGTKELSSSVIEEVYGCPVELIAHGHAHRVLPSHEDE